jgi:hypothetical protein
MIDPKKYYNEDENLSNSSKSKMWNAILPALKKEKNKIIFSIDRKSFAYGFAFAILLAFTSVGIYSLISGITYRNMNADDKISRAYLDASKKMEQSLSIINQIKNSEVKIANVLTVKKEQLDVLNKEINQLQNMGIADQFTSIQKIKLRELITMKINLINDMVELKERMKWQDS